MKIEVCYLIDDRGRVLWVDDGTLLALPDSSARWQAIWRWRRELSEIAHSHPLGPLEFSHEDETSMAAITAALGRAPRFSVLAPGGMVTRVDGRTIRILHEPAWAYVLRRQSGME
jgi:hypothetical protein